MDEVDRELEEAEYDASPGRFAYLPTHTSTISQRLSGQERQHPTRTLSRSRTQKSILSPVELERIRTQRTQQLTTVGSRRARTHVADEEVVAMGAGKPYPPSFEDTDEYLVEFEGSDDPLNAQNWPMRKKILLSCMLTYITFVASFASAIFSSAIDTVAHRFHVSPEVGVLGISLYVLGFATGPILWAPLSELSGRKMPLVLGMFGFSLFSTAVATAKDYQTIMLCRFFSGFCSASPLAIVPACFADLYNNSQRGIAITAFAMAVFMGPFTSPFIGGFITMSYLGWRWTMYISAIMGYVGTILTVVFLKETYSPLILVAKANRLRRTTKNWAIHAKQEEVEVDLHELLTNNFSRPIRLLVTEPIVLLMTIYMSFIYGLIYVFLSAYPLVFQGVYHMNGGVGGLPFIGLIVGQVLAGMYIMFMQKSYNRKLAANNNVPIPEWRLPPVIVGAVCFAGGLFWFGWTGFTRSIHWMVPTASGVLTGFGILCIFLQCFNYIIDSYLMFAASAVAANSVLRSLAGAGFPLFATQMFDNLGIQWAGTLLGGLAAVMIPIPIIFYIYGPKIRAKSKFSPSPDVEELAEKELARDESDSTPG